MLSFGEWLPDLPDFQNPGATEAKNVIPDVNGYRPFPDFTVVDNSSGAPTALVTGGYYDADNYHVYAASDDKKLRRYTVSSSASAWTDVSRTSGGAYTGVGWRFAKFGALVIAVNPSDATQGFEVGTDTDFSALAGSPPKAADIAVVRDFVVLVGDPSNPRQVTWSAINDPEDWTPSATTQSDTQEIPEGGDLRAIAGGEFGLIFQRNSIWRMTYVGSPLIFQFDRVSAFVGTNSRFSVAQYDNMTFFWGDSGLHAVVGGAQVLPIGEGKINRYLLSQYTEQPDLAITSACVDPSRKLYCALFRDDAGTKRILAYHWPTGRFSVLEPANIEFILACAGAGPGDGGEIVNPMSLSGFNTSHRHGRFIGSNLAATLGTTEAQIFKGRRAFVQGVYPIVDGGTDANITVALAARSAPNDTVTFGSAVAMNANGMSPQRSSGRYHRARVSIAAGASWTHAQGIEVEAVPEGKR